MKNQRNQCDGCMSTMPVVYVGLTTPVHYIERPGGTLHHYMVCQSYKYGVGDSTDEVTAADERTDIR